MLDGTFIGPIQVKKNITVCEFLMQHDISIKKTLEMKRDMEVPIEFIHKTKISQEQN